MHLTRKAAEVTRLSFSVPLQNMRVRNVEVLFMLGLVVASPSYLIFGVQRVKTARKKIDKGLRASVM